MKNCTFYITVYIKIYILPHRYTYEVTVNMEANGGLLKRHTEITLALDHFFTNFTRLLRSDDKIRFKGTLLNEPGSYNIGNKDLNVKAFEVSCLECKIARGAISSRSQSSSKLSELCRTIINDCVVSAKYILNFVLNPVIVFK